jgi:hypothetical protein
MPLFITRGTPSALTLLSKIPGWMPLSAVPFVLPLKARGLVSNWVRREWLQETGLVRAIPNFIPIKSPRRINPPSNRFSLKIIGESDDATFPPSNPPGPGLVQLFEQQQWDWLVKMPPDLAKPIGLKFFLDDALVGLSVSQIEPTASVLDGKILYMQTNDQSLMGWIVFETTRILADFGVGFIRACASTPSKIAAMQEVGYMKRPELLCHWWHQSLQSPPAQIDVGYLPADTAMPYLRSRT